MAKTSNVSVRIDPELKAQLEIIYAKHGLALSQALKLFMNESIKKNGFPFDLSFKEVSGEPRRRCDFCGNDSPQIKLLKSPLGTCICEDCSLICKILF
jgi:addiction module RelB/DinJ family antitoxin